MTTQPTKKQGGGPGSRSHEIELEAWSGAAQRADFWGFLKDLQTAVPGVRGASLEWLPGCGDWWTLTGSKTALAKAVTWMAGRGEITVAVAEKALSEIEEL